MDHLQAGSEQSTSVGGICWSHLSIAAVKLSKHGEPQEKRAAVKIQQF
jgi:hypothetical protein